jgi:hypothetical protein
VKGFLENAGQRDLLAQFQSIEAEMASRMKSECFLLIFSVVDPDLGFYVLLPYIIYVMPSGRFSHCPAFLSRTAKQRDKKYIVKSPQRYKK